MTKTTEIFAYKTVNGEYHSSNAESTRRETLLKGIMSRDEKFFEGPKNQISTFQDFLVP